jgi:hypothetical protein
MLLHQFRGFALKLGTSGLENGVFWDPTETGTISTWRKQHRNSYLKTGFYCQILETCHLS